MRGTATSDEDEEETDEADGDEEESDPTWDLAQATPNIR